MLKCVPQWQGTMAGLPCCVEPFPAGCCRVMVGLLLRAGVSCLSSSCYKNFRALKSLCSSHSQYRRRIPNFYITSMSTSTMNPSLVDVSPAASTHNAGAQDANMTSAGAAPAPQATARSSDESKGASLKLGTGVHPFMLASLDRGVAWGAGAAPAEPMLASCAPAL